MKTTTNKMKHTYLITAIVAATISIAGCSTAVGPNEGSGTVVGGILGGIAGNEIGGGSGRKAATIIGTLIGARIGGNIGRVMDDNDRLRVVRSLETANTGVATSWVNPDTNNRYTVTPTKTYTANTGPCREYIVNAVIGGRPEKVYGKACRQADGSWRVQG